MEIENQLLKYFGKVTTINCNYDCDRCLANRDLDLEKKIKFLEEDEKIFILLRYRDRVTYPKIAKKLKISERSCYRLRIKTLNKLQKIATPCYVVGNKMAVFWQ